ncbi:MAG: osmotically-inducible protein OsmY [Granulosicoccus sp.]
MKTRIKMALAVGIMPLVMLASGCQFTGEPLFQESEHSFNFGGATNDSALLSERVRQALRNNPETAIVRIQISELSEDSVKLSGFVDNDAISHQIERVAGQVEGVRFVVNSLFITKDN